MWIKSRHPSTSSVTGTSFERMLVYYLTMETEARMLGRNFNGGKVLQGES